MGWKEEAFLMRVTEDPRAKTIFETSHVVSYEIRFLMAMVGLFFTGWWWATGWDKRGSQAVAYRGRGGTERGWCSTPSLLGRVFALVDRGRNRVDNVSDGKAVMI